MVAGFAGFGFPKAHSAAFGLLAYQSTWLRVHYGPEFLCALLNEQPMGFYPPDSLAHEAQRRGIELRAVDINASRAECSVEDRRRGADRPRLRARRARRGGRGARARARGGRPVRAASPTSPRACPRRGASLEQLAWSGACDALRRRERRRRALGPRRRDPGRAASPGGTQLALALDAGADAGAARARAAGSAARRLRDERRHARRPRARDPAPAPGRASPPAPSSTAIRHGAQVTVAGLVVARQRPETASGVVFMLLEDEHGAINLIVPPALYERRRHIVRAEPLILAHGRLERPPAGGGTINVLVRELRTLDDELAGHRGGADRAARPPREVQSPPSRSRRRAERRAAGFRAGRTAGPELRRSGAGARRRRPPEAAQAGRRARSETTSSSASSTKFITTDEPP